MRVITQSYPPSMVESTVSYARYRLRLLNMDIRERLTWTVPRVYTEYGGVVEQVYVAANLTRGGRRPLIT